MVATCLASRWVACLVRVLVVNPEPLRWSHLLARDGAWGAHRHGRVTSLMRSGLCCVCEPRYGCIGGDVDSPPGSLLGADIAAATAVGLAEFIGGASAHGTRFSSVGAGLELMHSAAETCAEVNTPPGELLTPALAARCRGAVELHRYAIGAYTGMRAPPAPPAEPRGTPFHLVWQE